MRPDVDPFLLEGRWNERARLEVNEQDAATARRNVEHLRNLALSEKGFYPRTDDTFLLAFLRARKHDVEEAFRMMKNFYRLKMQYPQQTEDSLPSEKGFLYDMNGFTILREHDRHERPVVCLRFEDVDLKRVRTEHFFQMMVSLLTLLVQQPLVQVAGITILVDMTGFSLRHASIVTPTFARLVLRLLQDTFPMRMKAIHVVFEPFYFDAIFALFRPFLKQKLRKRIHLHRYNLSSLYSHIPQTTLPSHLGGDAEGWNFTEFRETMRAHEPLFREWRKFGYDRLEGNS